MASDRVQRQVDRLLDEAEEAITNDDWASVSNRARAVLAIDPDNKDGQSYLAAAERALGTSGATTGERTSSNASSTPPATGSSSSTDGSNLPTGLITYLSTFREAPHCGSNTPMR